MNKKLIAPIVSIAALAAVSIGTTYALFTDKKSADVIINAGKVKVDMESSINFALSRYEDEPPFDAVANAIALGSEHDAVYENGNTADLSSDVTTSSIAVTLDRMTPMDNISISVKVTNQSNVKIKWRLGVETEGELIPALDIKFDETSYSTSITEEKITYSKWSNPIDPSEDYLVDSDLYIAFPSHDDDGSIDNQFQEKVGHVSIIVEAVQGNAVTQDPLDQSYGFHNSYLADEGEATEHWVHEIATAEEFRNIYDSTVHEAKSTKLDYPGSDSLETVYLLTDDIDFGGLAPFGDYEDDWHTHRFLGTLDGNSHTIKNFVFTGSNTSYKDSVGLFCLYNENDEFKNITLDNCIVDGAFEKVGLLLGHNGGKAAASGELVIQNITVNPTCKVNASKSAGSIVGSLRGNNDVTIKNIVNSANVLSNDTNMGGLGGTCSTSNGKLTLISCVNNGNVAGSTYVGGLLGGSQNFSSFEIRNNILNGNVEATGTSSRIGFFVGLYEENVSTTAKTVVCEGNIVSGFARYNTSYSIFQELNFPSGINPSEGTQISDHHGANQLGVLNPTMVDNALTMDAYDGAAYYKVSVKIGSHSGSISNNVLTTESSGNHDAVINTKFNSVEELKSVKKLTRVGYVLPENLTIASVLANPAYTVNGRYEFYRLDSYATTNEFFDIAGDNGWGLVISNFSSIAGEVLNPVGTTLIYYVNAYDANGTLLATGSCGFAKGSDTVLKNIAGEVFDHNTDYSK